MSKEADFNWKYLIPGYGIFLIKKSDIKEKTPYIVINVILIFVLLGIIGSTGEDNSIANTDAKRKAVTEQSSTENKKQLKIGDQIKTEKFDLIVNSVTNRGSVGGEFLNEKASDGAIFVIVNFRYKNITREPVSAYNVPDVKIIDPNGTEYDEATGATIYYHTEINLNKKAVSDINPGITQKDAVVFEVSRDLWKSKGWKLIIDADEDIEVMVK